MFWLAAFGGAMAASQLVPTGVSMGLQDKYAKQHMEKQSITTLMNAVGEVTSAAAETPSVIPQFKS